MLILFSLIVWKNRYTQIRKRWRSLSLKEKEPFLKQAKENRLSLNSLSNRQVRYVIKFT